jgi:deoxyribodipyrimidine photo-lyase
MTTPPTIHWFRQDLRLADNPALTAAAASGNPVLAVFVWQDKGASPTAFRPIGGASRWWLHHSLAALSAQIAAMGGRLLLLNGDASPAKQLAALAAAVGAKQITFNHVYDAAGQADTHELSSLMQAEGGKAKGFDGNLLYPPGTVRTGNGGFFQVFTPFWRALLAMGTIPAALPIPPNLRWVPPPAGVASVPLADWRLLPTRPNWAAGFDDQWQPGEVGAQQRLASFIHSALANYDHRRDVPGDVTTSRLSPHLHWGEISPRQLYHSLQELLHAQDVSGGGSWQKPIDKFLSEVGWREFSYQLLVINPDLASRPLRPAFANFPWQEDSTLLQAWQRGQTGYPIVDAGMRELWTTGWQHNRVRMITASFLVKHLLQPWQRGEAWFWDTLVDADAASNPASWQWVAGCGADAAPYFRIFNPMLQGSQFDPDGLYVRRWVPELARLPNAYLHQPWTAPSKILDAIGLKLGQDYPHPIVDHAQARGRALSAFASISGTPQALPERF